MMASAALREIASYTVNERANLDWLQPGENLHIETSVADYEDGWHIKAVFYPRMSERKAVPVKRGGVWETKYEMLEPPVGRREMVAATETISAKDLRRAVQLREPGVVVAATEAAIDQLRYFMAVAGIEMSAYADIQRPDQHNDDALQVYADALVERGWAPTSSGRNKEAAQRILLGEARAIAARLAEIFDRSAAEKESDSR